MTADGVFRFSAQEWNGLDALANDDFDEAERVFDGMLWLNPSDNQGVRGLIDPVRLGKDWKGE